MVSMPGMCVHSPVEAAGRLQLLPLRARGVEAARMIAVDRHGLIDVSDLAVLGREDVERPIGDGKKGIVPTGNLRQRRAANHRRSGGDEVATPDILDG